MHLGARIYKAKGKEDDFGQHSAILVPENVCGYDMTVRGYLGSARLWESKISKEIYTRADIWEVRGLFREVRGHLGSARISGHKNSSNQQTLFQAHLYLPRYVYSMCFVVVWWFQRRIKIIISCKKSMEEWWVFCKLMFWQFVCFSRQFFLISLLSFSHWYSHMFICYFY